MHIAQSDKVGYVLFTSILHRPLVNGREGSYVLIEEIDELSEWENRRYVLGQPRVRS